MLEQSRTCLWRADIKHQDLLPRLRCHNEMPEEGEPVYFGPPQKNESFCFTRQKYWIFSFCVPLRKYLSANKFSEYGKLENNLKGSIILNNLAMLGAWWCVASLYSELPEFVSGVKILCQISFWIHSKYNLVPRCLNPLLSCVPICLSTSNHSCLSIKLIIRPLTLISLELFQILSASPKTYLMELLTNPCWVIF